MTSVLSKECLIQVDSFLETNKEEILKTLIDLVRIPSVRGEAMENAPFGKECARLLEASAKLYKKMGLNPIKNAQEGYLTAEYGEGEKLLGIFAHGDVVPPGDGWLFTKPFDPIIKDGLLIGRGCNDDKSGLVQMLYVVKMLETLNIKLKNRLLLFTGTNEESGMEDVRTFVKNEKMPDVSIIPDGSYPFYSGEKGRVTLLLQSKLPFQDILSFTGGDCYNKVLDAASVTFTKNQILYTEINEKIAEKNAFTLSETEKELKLSAVGRTAHAAGPAEGLNAAFLLAELLSDCQSLSENDRAILWEMAEMLETHYGDTLGIAGSDSVFGRLTCVNGMVKTVDKHPTLSFDIRYGLQITGKEILGKVQTIKQNWEITEHGSSDGYNLENSHPVAKALRKAYSFISGDDRDGAKMAAGTYARHLRNAFSVGTIATYKGKADFPEGHGGVHQPDEAISIEGFLEGIKILFAMILEVDAVL